MSAPDFFEKDHGNGMFPPSAFKEDPFGSSDGGVVDPGFKSPEQPGWLPEFFGRGSPILDPTIWSDPINGGGATLAGGGGGGLFDGLFD